MHVTPEDRVRLQTDILQQIGRRRSTVALLDQLCCSTELLLDGTRCLIAACVDRPDVLEIVSAPSIASLGGELPIPIAAEGPPCATAVFWNAPVVVPDLMASPDYHDERLFQARKFAAAWSMPFGGKEPPCRGSFTVLLPVPSAPTEETMALIESAAHLAELILSIQRLNRGDPDGSPGSRQTQDPVFVKDPTLRYYFANEAAAADRGIAPAQMVGTFDRDLFSSSLAERFETEDRTVLSTGRLLSYEDDYEDHCGRKRTFCIQKYPWRNRRGSIDGVIGIAQDVTALRASERAARATRRLENLGLIAGGIAHDFNNLLTGIVASVDRALGRPDASEGMIKSLQQIRSAAHRATEFSTRLLGHVRADRLTNEAVDIASLVRDAERLMRPSVPAQTKIEVRSEHAIPLVSGDPTQLRQVIMNLITNAAEAIGEANGRITMSVSPAKRDTVRPADRFFDFRPNDGPLVHVALTDTGCGISSESLDRIFDVFYTTKPSGTGLGLAGVIDIIRRHRGYISVHSREGAGTRFDVYFPAEREQS